MNICLFAIVNYWQGINGGMEIHGKALCEGLVKRGHDVTIISTNHPEGIEFEIQNGIKIHYLKNSIFGSRRKGWQKESIKKFRALNNECRFDVICCQSAVVRGRIKKIERLRRIPVTAIIESHEGMVFLSEIKQTIAAKEGFSGIFKNFLKFLYYYTFWELPLLHQYDAVIGVSDEVTRGIRRWHFMKSKKLHTVYNGIDTNVFRPDEKQRLRIRNIYAIESDIKVLLFLSHVTRQKGLDQFIHAMPAILQESRKVKLLVVGGGDYLEEAKRLIKKNNLNNHVIFTGPVAHQDAANYINASDIFVLPTLRQEGLPFAMLEAMACQKPVIVSRIGGVPSAITDGENGLLVSPGNSDELFNKTVYLLNNESLNEKLAFNAHRSVQRRFGIDIMIDRTVQVMENTIS
jgi:glycosyltransferase involved in cell wall biosynthesis